MVKSRTLDDFYDDQDISVDVPEVVSPPPALPSLSPTPYNPPLSQLEDHPPLPPLDAAAPIPSPIAWILCAVICLSVLAALRRFVLVPCVQRARRRWLQGSGVVLPSGRVGVPGVEAARLYLACRQVCRAGGPHTTTLEQWVDAPEEEVGREVMLAVTPALASLKEALRRMAVALEAFPGGGEGRGEEPESFPGFIEAVLSQSEECATLVVGGSDFAQLHVLAVGVQQGAVDCVKRAMDTGLESVERVQALLALLKSMDCGEGVLHPLKPIALWERALSHLVEVSHPSVPAGEVDAKEFLDRLDTALHEEATAAELIPRTLNATRRVARREAERLREGLMSTQLPPNPTLLMDAGGGKALLLDSVGGAGTRGAAESSTLPLMSLREGLSKGGGVVGLESGERGGRKGGGMGVEDFAHLTVALQGMNLADQQRRHQELLASQQEHHSQLMGVQTEATKCMKEELGRVSNTLQGQINAGEALRVRAELAEEGSRHWRALLVALQVSLSVALVTALALLWDTIHLHLKGYLPEGVCWNYLWLTSGWEGEGQGRSRGGASLFSPYLLWVLPTFGKGGGGEGGFSLLSPQLWSCARQWSLVMLALYPLGFLPTSLLPPIIHFLLTTPLASLPLAGLLALSSLRTRAFLVVAMLLGPNLGVYWCKRHLGGLVKTRCSERGASSLVGQGLIMALQVAVVVTCGVGCGTYVVEGSVTNTWRVCTSLLLSINDLLQ